MVKSIDTGDGHVSILEPTESFVVRYTPAVDFTNKQLSAFWLPTEINVEKDVHDIYTNLTEAERHGVLTVLKLFSLYELFAGRDYWTGRVMQMFPRPEIQRMAATFGMFELAIHQPFYDEINKLLGLSTDEFYSSYVDDPILKQRMSFIRKYEKTDLFLPMFVFLEGAVLYSSFAFLKHFQANGKNKLLNIVRGINFSVRDENLHAEAGAWLFREVCKLRPLSEEDKKKIVALAGEVLGHEAAIVDKIFEKGDIPGITAHQLRQFVQSRIDICLQNLGLEPVCKPKYNPIASHFYQNINGYTSNDFFSGIGASYKRGWKETEFKW